MDVLRKLLRGERKEVPQTVPLPETDIGAGHAAHDQDTQNVADGSADSPTLSESARTAPLRTVDDDPPNAQPNDNAGDWWNGTTDAAPVDEHEATTVEEPTSPTADSNDASTSAVLDDDATAELREPVVHETTRQLGGTGKPAISAQRSAQGLAATAARDIGRVREVNQDSVFALLTTLPREASDVSLGLFVVADGMGGHEGGEVASRLAVRTVVHEVLSQLVLPALDDNFTDALQPLMIGAVQEANRVIWDQAQSVGSDMGTTCTAVLMLGRALYIAHVGDTRAYLLEPGGLQQITTDHSTVGRLIQLGQLAPEDAREHPLRNQLYRTIGQQPEVQVDFVYQQLGESSHIFLCSDGLWGMVDDDDIEQALTHSPWTRDVCQELIALANLAGGEDNISAVVCTLPMAERST